MKNMTRVVLAMAVFLFLGSIGKGWAGNTAFIGQSQFTTGPYSGCPGCDNPGSSAGNSASIDQTAAIDFNTASIYQSGAGNGSYATQLGSSNTAITYLEGTEAFTGQYQSGNGNFAAIASGDVVNGFACCEPASDVQGYAYQTQFGVGNGAVLSRHTNFKFAGDPAYKNGSSQYQNGSSNGSYILQVGDQHFAGHAQVGDSNYASSSQSYIGDYVSISQLGNSNFASTVQ